jgi:hypothetical protein
MEWEPMKHRLFTVHRQGLPFAPARQHRREQCLLSNDIISGLRVQ